MNEINNINPPITLEEFQKLMMSLPQQETVTKHYFCEGLYAREIFVPAGNVIIGKIHKENHICTVAKGKICIWSQDTCKILQAGDTIISLAGVQRIGYTMEDTIWVNYHPNPNNVIDAVEIENRLIDNEQFLRIQQELKECPLLQQQ